MTISTDTPLDPQLDTAPAPASGSSVATRAAHRVRDVRLDVFRGAGLFIIFISHVPRNPWAQFIPGKFGFSDATEIFVFCSGMASALAFARVFDTHGALIGCARILHRCWQVYWAHIGCLLTVLACMIAAGQWLGTGDLFVRDVGLTDFLEPRRGMRLVGIMTLTYVPPYFDILPMYLVILALIPPALLLARIDPKLAMAASLVLWAIASQRVLELPRDPVAGDYWYFNPFSWQLVFFAGFAIMRGWLPSPPASKPLIAAAILLVVLAIPLSWKPWLDANLDLAAWKESLKPLLDKTHVGALRFLHFLALAYLATLAAGEKGYRLRGLVAELCRSAGQQALAVFMTGLTLSFIAGVVLTLTGRDAWLPVAAVNLAGIAIIIAVSWLVAWFKSAPWHRAAKRASGKACPGKGRGVKRLS